MAETKRYTISDIEAMEREFLTPSIVGSVLHWDPYSITLQARADASKLGFPVTVHGSRTLIPKAGFLNFYYGLKGART